MMRQLGIKTTELDVEKVVVFKADGSQLVVKPASVQVIEMQGQKQLQVSGEFADGAGEARAEGAGEGEGSAADADADAKIVAEQAKVPLEKARLALEASGGDIAEAIMLLEND